MTRLSRPSALGNVARGSSAIWSVPVCERIVRQWLGRVQDRLSDLSGRDGLRGRGRGGGGDSAGSVRFMPRIHLLLHSPRAEAPRVLPAAPRAAPPPPRRA